MKSDMFLEQAKQALQNLMPSQSGKNAFIHELISRGHRQEITNGSKSRAAFVSTQIAIELMIATMMRQNKLQAAACIIHTPRPSTPLLVQDPQQVDRTLVSKQVANNSASKVTVTNRIQTTRRLLSPQANIPMALLYHRSSLDKLTEKQQNALTMNDEYFQNLTLKPVDEEYLAGENAGFTGATYLVKDHEGRQYAYNIQAFQANSNDKETKQWGVWCGEYKSKEARVTEADHAVGERIDLLQQEILKPHQCDIEALLQQSEHMQRSSKSVSFGK